MSEWVGVHVFECACMMWGKEKCTRERACVRVWVCTSSALSRALKQLCVVFCVCCTTRTEASQPYPSTDSCPPRTLTHAHMLTHAYTHLHTGQDMTLAPVLTVEETFTHACKCVGPENARDDLVTVVMQTFGTYIRCCGQRSYVYASVRVAFCCVCVYM